MYDKHWSDEKFLEMLFGIALPDEHLHQCPTCMERWLSIQNRYRSLHPVTLQVSEEFLMAQRRTIRDRSEKKRRLVPAILVPAMITLVVAVTLIIFKPASPPPQVMVERSDSQLFEEVFQSVYGTEPSAVKPIRALFEVTP